MFKNLWLNKFQTGVIQNTDLCKIYAYISRFYIYIKTPYLSEYEGESKSKGNF